MIPYWWTLTIPSRIAGRRRHVADPPAGHRVRLREAAHQDRPLAHPRQRAHRPVAVRAVRQPVVDLVAVDEQVVADGDLGQRVLDLVGQDGAGRVARIAEEERLGPRRDRRLDRGRVEREVVLEARRDVADDAAGEDDRRDVGDVRRLVEDDLVARVARRAQGEVDGLRGTDRDQDLGRRVVADAVAVARGGATGRVAARACRSCWCSASGPRAGSRRRPRR